MQGGHRVEMWSPLLSLVQVTLTDHCAVAKGMADLAPLVVEILDHHKDVGALPVRCLASA